MEGAVLGRKVAKEPEGQEMEEKQRREDEDLRTGAPSAARLGSARPHRLPRGGLRVRRFTHREGCRSPTPWHPLPGRRIAPIPQSPPARPQWASPGLAAGDRLL
jgi:hypothetical protein